MKLNPVSVSTVKVTGFGSAVVTNKNKVDVEILVLNPRKNSLAELSRTVPMEMRYTVE